jgi:hypothetical protein
VILAVPAPSPLDALLAWPLVVMDRWVGAAPGHLATGPPAAESALLVLAGLLLGIVLTWVHYIIVARLLILWRTET